MSNKYLEDGETFTDEWKYQISTHPVILTTSQSIIKSLKSGRVDDPNDDYDVHNTYQEFLANILEASKKFYALSTDAFDQVEKVQDGLHLVTSMLYQFNPKLEEFSKRIKTYSKVNEIFWGHYFYWHGVDGAQELGKVDSLSTWQAANAFAEGFWKFGADEFMPTIAQGVRYVQENLKRETEIAARKLYHSPTRGGVH